MQEQSIFIEALEKQVPAERAAFLERVCGDDLALRQRIEKLLQRHHKAGSFLESKSVQSLNLQATRFRDQIVVVGDCQRATQLVRRLMNQEFAAITSHEVE